MIGKLLMLILTVVIGWVAYTQFFGTEKEQKIGKEVIDGGKKTINGIIGIFNHEKDKLQSGEYDKTVDKVIDLLNKLKSNTENEREKSRLENFEQESQRLKTEIHKEGITEEERTENVEALKKLVKDIDVYLDEKK